MEAISHHSDALDARSEWSNRIAESATTNVPSASRVTDTEGEIANSTLLGPTTQNLNSIESMRKPDIKPPSYTAVKTALPEERANRTIHEAARKIGWAV